jgi:rhodanese-related sulfurtransferase
LKEKVIVLRILTKSTRRGVLVGVASIFGLAAFSQSFSVLPDNKRLSVEEAHDLAQKGDVLLIDIRTPDEWASTGVGEGANPIDMRREDFIAKLDAVVGGNRTRSIAIICAAGVRSKWVSAKLSDAGFTTVFDVPEGMLGSPAGPGWIRNGLPVVK